MLESAGAAAAVGLTNRAGATPLHLALGGGFSDVTAAELLIQAGSPATAADVEGVTPLHLAAALGDETLLRSLLKAGASPAAADSKGRTPLAVALACGDEATAALLGGEAEGSALCAAASANLPTELLSHPSCLMHTAAAGPLVVRPLLTHLRI